MSACPFPVEALALPSRARTYARRTPRTPRFPVEWKKGLVAEVGSCTVAMSMSKLVRPRPRSRGPPRPLDEFDRKPTGGGVLGMRRSSRNVGVDEGERRLYKESRRFLCEATLL